MHILCDEKIPFAREAFSGLGEVTIRPCMTLEPSDLIGVDVLIARSGRRLDEDLLKGSTLQFVGSATAGTDHVDLAYLRDRGIPFSNAPGCNADSVVEYLIAALLSLSMEKGEALEGKTLGIVGAGAIGRRLMARMPYLGLKILVNDPPRAAIEGDGAFVPLKSLLAQSDILTLHVPLTRHEPHKTWHLLDADTLQHIKPGAWLINASRGGVLSSPALREAIEESRTGAVVLDVWEDEPRIDQRLLSLADRVTPHIAGHSFDGKINGTIQLYQALCALLKQPEEWDYEKVLAPRSSEQVPCVVSEPSDDAVPWLHALVQQLYDIQEDDQWFRSHFGDYADGGMRVFKDLRAAYPRRRSFKYLSVAAGCIPAGLVDTVQYGLQVSIQS